MALEELAVDADASDVLSEDEPEGPLPLFGDVELLEIAGGEDAEYNDNVSAPLTEGRSESDCEEAVLMVKLLLGNADVAPGGTSVISCTPMPVDRSVV